MVTLEEIELKVSEIFNTTPRDRQLRIYTGTGGMDLM